ncbi:hypothetical protein [Sandarakinorhabdus sp.]|uniref:hypothetical protein n=1 Tax=Sandarakinorhabdus sp. TaxID=1916663 RepID=UPI00286D6E97|nr:hypothetical protein [Sandarakinorhabdus sp.]
MPTHNVIPILMTLFTMITIAGILVPLVKYLPGFIEKRRTREIDQMTKSAAALAVAIARHDGNSSHGARLMANYRSHADALAKLGQPVPPLVA